MEEKIAFGKYIADKRKERGLTQKSLAEQLFISESAVSKWERGKSYPDITLVTSICQILNITEHELITASDDMSQRLIEKKAKTLTQLIHHYHLTWGVIYIALLIGCFIGDLVRDGRVDWFFIVLGGVLISASLTNVPVIVKDHKGWWTLASFTLSLILMFGICNLYFGVNWFFIAVFATLLSDSILFLPLFIKKQKWNSTIRNHAAGISFLVDSILLLLMIFSMALYTGSLDTLLTKAYPGTLYGLIYVGLLIGIIRYTPFNLYMKWGLSLLLSGIYMVISNPILEALIDGNDVRFKMMMREPLTYLSTQMDLNALIGIVLMALSVLFIVAGLGVKMIKQSKRLKEESQREKTL